jgi:hypothetical protein
MSYLEIIEKLKQSEGAVRPVESVSASRNEINELNEISPVSFGEPHVTSRIPPRWWEPGSTCWHCQGQGTCRCILCDVGGVSKSNHGPCVVCHGNGKVRERVQ